MDKDCIEIGDVSIERWGENVDVIIDIDRGRYSDTFCTTISLEEAKKLHKLLGEMVKDEIQRG